MFASFFDKLPYNWSSELLKISLNVNIDPHVVKSDEDCFFTADKKLNLKVLVIQLVLTHFTNAC